MLFIKTIRAKTLLSTLIPMALMLAAVAVISSYAYERVTQELVMQRDIELARVSARRLSEGLTQYSRLLQNIAVEEEVRSMEAARLSSALEKAQARLYFFDAGFAVYNEEGVALCSQSLAAERRETDFPIPSEFDNVRRTLRPAFSNVFEDAISGQDMILIGAPVLGSGGEFKGVLAGMCTLKYSLLGALYAEVLEFKAGRSGYAYLVDGNGRIIYHRYSSLVGSSLADIVPVMRVTRGETGAVLTEDATGQTVISGFAPVPGTGWGLITQERWDVVIGTIQGYRTLLLGILAVGSVLSGSLVFFSISRILRPIRDLTRRAKRIAGGDFDYTIAARTGDEIEALARQFNLMAGALKESFAGLEQRLAERKLAEEELRKQREHLEELVKERTGELEERTLKLEQVNIHLQEADRLKSVFLASMSHELRTPLNSIIGFAGIILQGMVGELNEEQKRQLTIVKKSADHLLYLINDLLDISRIEAGKVELSLEEFRLGDILQEVAESFSPVASEKDLELLMDLPEGIRPFNDRRRVKQILMNLVSNAVKFTDHGSIKIAAMVLKDETLQISVTDTGIGIKKQDLHKLFLPFQQVDMSLTKRHEGTGLGLYIIKKLLILLGGDIRVKSEHGRGSEFTFSMPLKCEEELRNEENTGG